MAVVWGEAEVVLHTDGRALPGEVRAATTEAATVGGKNFQRVFRREMRKAATTAVADFARAFGQSMARVLQQSQAFQALTRRLRMLRTDFRILGNYMRGTFSDAVTGVRNRIQSLIQPFREFGQEVGERSARAVAELREGMTHLKISGDDLRDTFPGITRVVDNARASFGRFRNVVGRAAENIRDFRDRALAPLRPVVDDVGTAWERMSARFSKIRQSFSDNRQGVLDLRVAMENLRIDTEKVTSATNDTERSHNRLRRTMGSSASGVRKFLSSWKSLPHGFRQAVFWTGLVISALGSLSVLSSALSGTIIALITQIAALGAALGFAVVGFIGLYAEGAKLTEGAIAAKNAFSDLGDAFAGIRDIITNNMFEGMADSISNITNVLLPALEGNIATFSQTVGQSLGRIFDALSSPAGIENFKALLDGFSPILESLTSAAISFGDAFADILIASLPTAQAFAGAIADVAAQFSAWTSSEEGRARLAEFFATAERIMPAVVDLVVAFGQALAELVTPTTIAGVETFIQSLTDFMPVLGQIVGIIANLNVFGILAAALQLIGAALAPLIEPLSQFATILGQELIEGLQMLMPHIGELAAALSPILEVIIAIATAALPPLIDIIASVIDYLTLFVEALVGADADSEEFKNTIEIVGQVVGTVFQVLATVIQVALTSIGGMLKATSLLLKGDFSGAFKAAEDMVRSVFKAMGWDFDAYVAAVEDMVREVSNFFRDIGRAIENFGKTVSNVFSGVIGWISDAVNWFGSLFGAANKASGAASSASRSGGSGRAFASGGLLNGPTRILAGEAGPEAIVPLRRSLNMVDPSVRWLSAIAQGKDPAMANGGVVGGGRSVTVEAGAIQVNGAQDPARTSLAVLNRLTERIAG